MQTSIHVIAEAAKKDKTKRFRSLYSFLNREVLRQAFQKLNKDASAGIDGVTYKEYEKDLEQNLIDLETRLKEKRYHAKVVRRTEIPKGDGKLRPLGIPALEDKLVQQVVRDLLQALFEPLFLDCNHGYRPNRSARRAVEALWEKLMTNRGWVVEVDIKSFFDTIDHEWMIKMVEKRVNDSAIIGLIKQWLTAGVMHKDGTVENPEEGTPQGGTISPILANIYLHYVIDKWFQDIVKPQNKGDSTLIRYADDFVGAFRFQEDAQRFFKLLPDRLAKFGLALSEEKTRKIRFSRFDKDKSVPFDFLGFTFMRDVSRKGNEIVRVLTSTKKLRSTISEFASWIRENRNKSVSWIMNKVAQKLRGHRNYFGIQGNSARVWQVFQAFRRLLFKWLNRRSQRKSYNWRGFTELLKMFDLQSNARLRNFGVQLSFLPFLSHSR